MELLKEKIRQAGKVMNDDVLKVDSFLNHQIDVALFNEMGKEFKRRFENKRVTKILTIEASGIAIACIAAQYFHVPVVFAKKQQGSNMDEYTYEAEVYSFTKDKVYKIRVAKEYIQEGDEILILDDFLANGNAVMGLLEIIGQAGARAAGVGIAIEKGFQGGRQRIEEKGIQVESLAIVGSLKNGQVKFKEE